MKRAFLAFLMILTMMLMSVTALASDEVRTGDATETNPSSSSQEGSYTTSDDDDMSAFVQGELDEFTPNVTTNDIINKLNDKGNDVVSILQTVGKYVCIGAFIVCCILTLVGLIGNKRILAGALIGLVVSGLAYAGIVCGREIVNWIAAWARS